ncbi:hypothetical protein M5K25_014038 [Dendrobium thyrsiflorum]|uniref:Uncharacterized protein n=1 Tax=Dendrobium thyrsiflorum TaxID=117978 RepID=A0ABD0UUP2_DENTH
MLIFARVCVLINKNFPLPKVNISVAGHIFSLKIVNDWKSSPCSGCDSLVYLVSPCSCKLQDLKNEDNVIVENDRGRSKTRNIWKMSSRSSKSSQPPNLNPLSLQFDLKIFNIQVLQGLEDHLAGSQAGIVEDYFISAQKNNIDLLNDIAKVQPVSKVSLASGKSNR